MRTPRTPSRRNQVKKPRSTRVRLFLEPLEERALPSHYQLPPDLVNWRALGPAPLGPSSNPNSGRITALAAHPTDANTIYIAAASGGVWKTTNGGAAWTPLTDNQSTLMMGALALAPSNPSIIYAGTGEATLGPSKLLFRRDNIYPGRGVLKSTDAGATWTLLGSSVFDRRTISTIVVHPTDPNTVYLAVGNEATNGLSGNTGIWKSTDGGLNWVNTTTAISTSAAYTDIVMHPSDPGILYIGVGEPSGSTANGIYQSTNAGDSWTLLSSFPSGAADINVGYVRLAISPSSPQTLYANAIASGLGGPTLPAGRLYRMMKSTDGGASWTNITAGVPESYLGGFIGPEPNFFGDYVNTLIVDRMDPNIVYAGGVDLIRSTNGGVTWTFVGGSTHHDHHGIGFDALDRLLDGNDGGIWRQSSPRATTYTNLNGNLNTIQFTGIALHPNNPNIAFGGSQDNGTERFNHNPLWTITDGSDGGFVRVDPVNPNVVYHTIYYDEKVGADLNSIFFRRSTNGGTSWSVTTTGIDTSLEGNFYPLFTVDAVTLAGTPTSRILLGTQRVYESTNQASSWSALGTFLFPGPIDSVGGSPADINVVYAASEGRVFVTTNRGVTWLERNPIAPNPVLEYKDIQVDPSNPQTAYIVAANFGDLTGGGHIWRTTDAGVTWVNITGNLPDVPTWTVALDMNGPDTADDVLYLGTDTGVYVSQDQGSAWSRHGAGLPNVHVVDLEVNKSLGILAAGTNGRGLWEIGLSQRSTGGLTVGPNINITQVSTHDAEGTIAINPTNPRNLFAAWVDSGTAFAKYSTDGGLTWSSTNTSAVPSSCCDGQAAWDSFGNLFLTYLDTSIRVVVARSIDGGATLIDARIVSTSGDQPSIAFGPGPTPGTGSVWVSFEQGGQIRAAGAPVGGLGSVGAFTTPQTAPGTSGGSFGGTAVGPNGQVMVISMLNSGPPGATDPNHWVRINLDPDGLGPAPFGPAIQVLTSNVAAWDLFPAQPERSAGAEPNLAWDRSGGPHRGRVYLVHLDEEPNESHQTDVFLRYSDDNGTTWSAPRMVNDEPRSPIRTQIMPAIAVDQTTGNVAITWYDARNSPGNNTLQLFGTVSLDGGETFAPNVQISAGTSDATVPAAGGFDFGDYDTMDFHAGVFYRIWADNSNSTSDNPSGTLNAADMYTAQVRVGLGVTRSLPANGAIVAVPPTSFVIQLSGPYDPASVHPGDLTVNGIPADNVALTSSDVLTFTYNVSPVTTQGVQTLAVAGGAITGLDGSLVQPFSATFRFDAVPMQVVSTTPPAGSVVELPFTTLIVRLNEPVAPTSVQAADLTLSQGMATGFTLLDSNTAIQFTLSGITGEGTLTASIAAGALTDVFGNPNLAFSAEYTLDIATIPYPLAVAARLPLGSLVYTPGGSIASTPAASHIYELDGSFADALGGPSMVSAGGTLGTTGYTFAAGQGPNLSNAVNATTYSIEMLFRIDAVSSFRKLIDFKNRTSDNGLYNESTALYLYPDARGPDGAFTAGRLHHLVITRDGATGRFVGYVDGVQQISLTDSGALGTFTGPGNIIHFLRDDTTTTSEQAGGFLDRVRIYNNVLTAEQVTALFNEGSASEPSTGTILPAGDTDSFTISVDAGQTITILARPTSASLQPTIELFQEDALVGSAAATAPGRSAVLQTIRTGDTLGGTAAPRIYRVAVRGTDGTTGPYALQIILNAAVEDESHGGPTNNTRASAQDLAPTFLLLDEGDPPPARGAVLGQLGLAAGDQDFYSFTLQTGDSATLALKALGAGNVDLELQNASGARLAIGRASTNLDEVISNFVALAAGTYYARITGTAGTSYNLVVTRNANFDIEPNHPIGNAPDLIGAQGAAHRWALGHTAAADPDFYKVVVLEGNTLEVTTITPAQLGGEFANGLNPRVRLYRADGTLVAEDDNSGSDGRNARLSYLIPVGAGGIYSIEVLPSAAAPPTSGEYILQVRGAETVLPLFRVTASNPADGARVRGPITQVTVDFNDAVLATSLIASDLTIDGTPATGFTLVDADTVRFTLAGGLTEGFHEIRIAAGLVLDVQGTGIEAFVAVFYHDITAPRVTFIAPGPAVLIPGTVPLVVVFSEPMRVANLDPTDFTLVGTFTGPKSPASFTFFGDGTVLVLSYNNLPEDHYTLTLLSADGRFEDVVGFNLDGSPSSPLPSGDGVEGGNFVTTIDVDNPTTSYIVPLVAQPSLGSLVYAPASAGSSIPAPTHIYELDGSFADALGGPSIVPAGGTLGATGYTFAAGQGPNLSGAVNPTTYSVEMLFRIDSISSYRKLIDFKNRTLDEGLYNQDGVFRFFPDSGPAGVFTAGRLHHLVITRDGASNRFAAYVDGVQRITFIDSTNRATFSGPGNIIHFLRDDGSEHPSGFLDRVRTYDRALTAEQVMALVNEPPPSQESLGIITPADDTDSFTLDIDPGQTISVVVIPITPGLRPTVTVTGPGITPFTAAAFDFGRKAVLNATGVTLGGTYTITVGSAAGIGQYSVQVLLNAAFEAEAQDGLGNDSLTSAQDLNSAFTPLAKGATRGAVLGRTDPLSAPDYFAFTVAAGERVTLALEGQATTNVNLELRSATDEIVATGVAGAANADRFIYNVELTPGTYFARVTSAGTVNYNLVITRGAVFEREGNNTPDDANDFTGTVGALGHLRVADEDWYSISLSADQPVLFCTLTPADGPGAFVNLLDPHLELYDPSGNLVAVGVLEDDGRNERIEYVVPADRGGLYRIRVIAENGTEGEYFLDPIELASDEMDPRSDLSSTRGTLLIDAAEGASLASALGFAFVTSSTGTNLDESAPVFSPPASSDQEAKGSAERTRRQVQLAESTSFGTAWLEDRTIDAVFAELDDTASPKDILIDVLTRAWSAHH